MRLLRYGKPGLERPAVILRNGVRRDVSAFTNDFDEAFFANDGLEKLAKWLKSHANECPEVAPSVRLGPCVARPSKLVCIGLNYRKHAEECGMDIPTEPIIFLKATSAICGPNDAVELPRGSEKADWEVELALVIGRRAKYVSREDAMDYVAGYAVHNDYSERAFQLERGGQWVKGKSADTFAPLGPYLVTKEDIPDPHDLRLWLRLNGSLVQEGNTKDFIFDIPHLVSYLSQYMTLLPGDVISTGTPAGVGSSFDPPRYLKTNDVIECGIEGLGNAMQLVV